MPLTPETWLEEFTVNLTTASSQSRPRITQLANGNILVSWESSDDTGVGSTAGIDMIGQIFTPMGEPVSVEFRLNINFDVDDEQGGDIAALPGGGFVVVFEDNSTTTNSIRLQEFDAAGNIVQAITSVISDSTVNAAPGFSNPAVAVSSATSVLIVWQEAEVGGDTRIVGKTYDPTTDTYSAEISLINFAGDNIAPVVTVLSNGNYVIACATTATGGDQFITYRIVNSAGANVLAVTEIATTQADSQNDREPSVTALTGGGFVISWTNTDLNDTEVFVNVFNAAGVSVTGEIAVSDDGATDNDNESSVVALSDGGFIVLFDNDLAGELNGQRFDAAGGIVGSEFTVSTGGGGIDEIDAVLLGDGRVAISFERGNGEIGMEIIDTRDAANLPEYAPVTYEIGTIGDDTIIATAAQVHGHDGNDTITDGSGSNTIFGGQGDDSITINGVSIAESLFGGAGNDTLIGQSLAAGAIFDLAAGTVTSGAIIQVAAGFEHVIGTNVSEVFLGSNIANSLSGGGGDDSMNGGFGFDTTIGGTGNDTYFVSALGDVIIENAAQGTNDRVIASGNYILGAGVDVERLSASSPAGVVAINLFGNELSQVISGNNGVNVLSSGTGLADTLRGFVGNDIYRVFNAGDIIVEVTGEGVADRVAAAVDFVLAADDDIEFLATDNVAGVSAIDLTGNALSQVITGNAGANILSTGGGVADTMQGFGGSDIYRVFNAGDVIIEVGGGGTDRVAAAVSFNLAADDNIETLATNGSAGLAAIDLRGNALGQRIEGNAGANVLNGLGGSDTLTGFGGADTFAFNSALGPSNVDIITDYDVAADHILLENAVFIGLAVVGGVLAGSAFSASINGVATDSSDRIMYETDTGFLWYDQDGTGSLFARIKFADLDASLAMTASEFTVV